MIGVRAYCLQCDQDIDHVPAQTPPRGTSHKGIIACPQGHRHILTLTLTRADDAAYAHTNETPYTHAQRLTRQGETIANATRAAGISERHYYRTKAERP